MRLSHSGLTLALIGALFLSPFVSSRFIFIRGPRGIQHGHDERKDVNWDDSTPIALRNTPSSLSFTALDMQCRQETNPGWLRIMALGASIVRGLTSNPEDGFRKPLRDHLISKGFKVNIVGSQCNKDGSMQDGQHEGHSGHRIDQINHDMDLSANTKPNLYLINAGTNDCQQNYLNMQGTIGRLNDLLNKAWESSGRATITLSTLLPSSNEGSKPGVNDRVNTLNDEIRNLARTLNGAGKRIQLADMNDGYIKKSDLIDGIHPTADGYQKMAEV